MLTLTTQSWGKLPIAQMAPHDANDLIIFLSPKVAILLKDIVGFDRAKFSIMSAMTSDAHKDVFFTEKELKKMVDDESKKEVFKNKLEEFALDMRIRLERYFITGKMPRYLFFDEKEQVVIHKILSDIPWFCQVVILRNTNGKFEPVSLDSLSSSGLINLKKMLGSVKLKVDLSMDEYCLMKGKSCRPAFNKDEITTKRIFEKYPFFNVESQEEFKKVAREKLKELHPDRNKDRDTTEEFQEIKEAISALEETMWYRKLKKEAEKSDSD